MAAETARRVDPQLASIYHRQMVERGCHHTKAVCAVATALASRLATVLREQRPYELRDIDGTPVDTDRAREIIARALPDHPGVPGQPQGAQKDATAKRIRCLKSLRDSYSPVMERREPILSPVGPDITAIDTDMIGERELNAVYFISGSAPTLVETGPGADVPVVLEALHSLGVDAGDLAHLVVTHIHVDHAGGAGALLRHFPRATLWAHERGVPHLVDPSRLVASTARTYGRARMDSFFGATEPVPAERVRAVTDGDRIDLGDRTLAVIHTPGHASHHVALHDDGTGAMFTGEAIGSYLPWGPAFRPALPPPEVDIEQALASIDRISALQPTQLLTSHFGRLPSNVDGCALAKEAILTWNEVVRRILESEPEATEDRLVEALAAHAAAAFAEQAGRPLGVEAERYDILGSTAMNAAGLARYWRKRWEREQTVPG